MRKSLAYSSLAFALALTTAPGYVSAESQGDHTQHRAMGMAMSEDSMQAMHESMADMHKNMAAMRSAGDGEAKLEAMERHMEAMTNHMEMMMNTMEGKPAKTHDHNKMKMKK